MKKVFLVLTAVLLVGCGSRKVDLKKRIADIEHNLNIKTKELEIERNKLRLYESSRIVKADSIVEENGKRKIYNPSTEEKTTEKEQNSEIEKTKEEDKKESIKDNSSEVDKKVDRAQHSFWSLAAVVGGLALCGLILYKFK